MSIAKLIKLQVSLKGRPVKNFKFGKDSIIVGRSPEADVYLDNPGVSREHMKIERTPGGYYAVQDLGSANGTFINDVQVQREYLTNNDVIRLGKYTMVVSYEEERRGTPESPKSERYVEGTTVLSLDELETLRANAQAEPDLSVIEGRAEADSGSRAPSGVQQPWVLFAAGGAVGALVMWAVSTWWL